MSSALWFKRAKAALALVEWLESGAEGKRDLFELLHTRALLEEYRRLTANLRADADRRASERDRRTRTDQGRETDARAASAGNLVK